MPLFLITGLPGSGKSTTCEELQSRGYMAYDGDYDGLAAWYSLQTGLEVKKRDEDRTAEFGRTHSRDIKRHKVESLADQAQDKPIFLCADPENIDELREFFAKIFMLTIDEDTRRYRLATRTNNKWGKLAHEVERDQIFRKKAAGDMEKFNYVTIDATRSTNDIVDYILEMVNEQ